jgi:hypothetical protein
LCVAKFLLKLQNLIGGVLAGYALRLLCHNIFHLLALGSKGLLDLAFVSLDGLACDALVEAKVMIAFRPDDGFRCTDDYFVGH